MKAELGLRDSYCQSFFWTANKTKFVTAFVVNPFSMKVCQFYCHYTCWGESHLGCHARCRFVSAEVVHALGPQGEEGAHCRLREGIVIKYK